MQWKALYVCVRVCVLPHKQEAADERSVTNANRLAALDTPADDSAARVAAAISPTHHPLPLRHYNNITKLKSLPARTRARAAAFCVATKTHLHK